MNEEYNMCECGHSEQDHDKETKYIVTSRPCTQCTCREYEYKYMLVRGVKY